MYKISILLPTYNRASYLDQALESITQQTYSNFEVIIVDDVSNDDTKSVVEKYQKYNIDIKYYRNDSNMGSSYGFDKCASLATGDYFLVFSDDDLLYPKSLAKFVDNIGNNDIIYSKIDIIDGDNNYCETWIYNQYGNYAYLLNCIFAYGQNFIPEVMVIKRQTYFETYKPMYTHRNICLYYLNKIDQLLFKYIPEPLYMYRVSDKSTIANKNGVIMRGKTVATFLNAILYQYSPSLFNSEIMGINNNNSYLISKYLRDAIYDLMRHAQIFLDGDMYNGFSYDYSYHLWGIYFDLVYYWMNVKLKYDNDNGYFLGLKKILSDNNYSEYNRISDNMLPDIYSRLPFFSCLPRGDENVDFYALDIVIYNNVHVVFDNDLPIYVKHIEDIKNLESYLSCNVVHYIYVREADVNSVIDILEKMQKFFVNVVVVGVQSINFSSDLVKNISVSNSYVDSFV